MPEGNILIGNESNKAKAREVRGDITLDKNGVTALIDVLSSGTISSTWGDATMIPQIKLDKKGRVISITEKAISGIGSEAINLSSGKIFVGNELNKAFAVDMSGDVTINNTGATVIGDSKITSSKILDGTILVGDLASNSVTSVKIVDGTIVNEDIATATITDAKLATITTPLKVSNSATTATATNTASAIVARDASNNFSAGTITAALTGNVLGNLTGNASTASSLAGGNLGEIPYQSAAGSTSYLTPGTSGFVLKSKGNAAPAWEQLSTSDLTGTYSLTNATGVLPSSKGGTGIDNGSYTISLTGNTTLTGTNTGDQTIKLEGAVTGTGVGTFSTTITNDAVTSAKIANGTIVDEDIANATITDAKLATITTPLKVSNSATTATATNTASAIVARDASNNFSAGTITAALTGNVLGNLTGNASTASSLAGGNLGEIPYQSAAGSTSYLTPGTSGFVLKSKGNAAPAWEQLSTSDLTGTYSLTNATGVLPSSKGGTGIDNGSYTISLTGNTTLTGTNTGDQTIKLEGAVTGTGVGTFSTTITDDAVTSAKIANGTIVNADISEIAAISDTKLGTISSANKVSNSATSATATNTINTIVLRDESGNFTAGTITASLTGNASTATTASNLAGGVAGAITYQSAAGTTTFTAAGTAGQVLKSNGNLAPTWTNLSLTDITSGTISLTSQVTGVLPIANGGTGVSTTPSNGQIDIGNGTGFTRTTLTAGTGISITNGPGTITITSTVDDADEDRNGKIRLSGDLTGSASTPVIGNGKINSAKILNASIENEDIKDVTITDAKLANITTAGKVANSATTATSSNTFSSIVARDASGNFTASTITGTLSGTASSATNLTGTTIGSVPYQSASGVTSFSEGGSVGDVLIRTSGGMVWGTEVSETLSQASESGNNHTFTLSNSILSGKMIKVYDSSGNKIANSKITSSGTSVTVNSGKNDDLSNYEFVYYK